MSQYHPITEIFKSSGITWDEVDQQVRTYLSEKAKVIATNALGYSPAKFVEVCQQLGLQTPSEEAKHDCEEAICPICKPKTAQEWCRCPKPNNMHILYKFCEYCGTPRPKVKSLWQELKEAFPSNLAGRLPHDDVFKHLADVATNFNSTKEKAT